MTINEAITLADDMKPNMLSMAAKVKYINEIEGKVHAEILMKHEHTAAEETCPHYDNSTDQGTELLVKAPYDMLYVFWIMTRIDILNQEMDKFNDDYALFQNAWDNYGDNYINTHMPLTARPAFRI